MAASQFHRLAEHDRPIVHFLSDGRACEALAGDTLLTALLTNGRCVRSSEFGDGRRAGFCLMGACQDCWIWSAKGDRLRACSTSVVDGMAISTQQPEGAWGNIEPV